MKKVLVVAACFLFQVTAHAIPTRINNPNDISLELGGRALQYSVNYTRTLSDFISFGLGYGGVSTNNPDGTPSSYTAAIIPAFVNFYLSETESATFFTVGGDLVTNSTVYTGQSSSIGGLRFASSPLILSLGLGYEYRAINGLVVRLAGYGLYSSSFIPWAGLTFGVAF